MATTPISATPISDPYLTAQTHLALERAPYQLRKQLNLPAIKVYKSTLPTDSDDVKELNPISGVRNGDRTGIQVYRPETYANASTDATSLDHINQMASHEAVHLVQNAMPESLTSKFPVIDKKDRYADLRLKSPDLLKLRENGDTLWNHSAEGQASIVQNYVARHDWLTNSATPEERTAYLNDAGDFKDNGNAQFEKAYQPYLNDLGSLELPDHEPMPETAMHSNALVPHFAVHILSGHPNDEGQIPDQWQVDNSKPVKAKAETWEPELFSPDTQSPTASSGIDMSKVAGAIPGMSSIPPSGVEMPHPMSGASALFHLPDNESGLGLDSDGLNPRQKQYIALRNQAQSGNTPDAWKQLKDFQKVSGISLDEMQDAAGANAPPTDPLHGVGQIGSGVANLIATPNVKGNGPEAARAGTQILNGGMDVLSPFLATGLAKAPLSTVGGLATGAVTSKAVGDVAAAHGVNPDIQQFLRTAGFFIPSAVGIGRGLVGADRPAIQSAPINMMDQPFVEPSITPNESDIQGNLNGKTPNANVSLSVQGDNLPPQTHVAGPMSPEAEAISAQAAAHPLDQKIHAVEEGFEPSPEEVKAQESKLIQSNNIPGFEKLPLAERENFARITLKQQDAQNAISIHGMDTSGFPELQMAAHTMAADANPRVAAWVKHLAGEDGPPSMQTVSLLPDVNESVPVPENTKSDVPAGNEPARTSASITQPNPTANYRVNNPKLETKENEIKPVLSKIARINTFLRSENPDFSAANTEAVTGQPIERLSPQHLTKNETARLKELTGRRTKNGVIPTPNTKPVAAQPADAKTAIKQYIEDNDLRPALQKEIRRKFQISYPQIQAGNPDYGVLLTNFAKQNGFRISKDLVEQHQESHASTSQVNPEELRELLGEGHLTAGSRQDVGIPQRSPAERQEITNLRKKMIAKEGQKLTSYVRNEFLPAWKQELQKGSATTFKSKDLEGLPTRLRNELAKEITNEKSTQPSSSQTDSKSVVPQPTKATLASATPSAPTSTGAEAGLEVSTPFKDEKGKPLVMYHGSPSNFDTFDDSKINPNDPDAPYNGHWFTTSYDDAHTAGSFPWGRPNTPGGGVTKAYYLDAKTPISRLDPAVKQAIEEAKNSKESGTVQTKVRKILKARGYDAIVHEPYVMPDEEEFNKKGEVKLGKKGYKLVKDLHPSGGVNLFDSSNEHVTGYYDFKDAVNSLKHGTYVALDTGIIKPLEANNSGANPETIQGDNKERWEPEESEEGLAPRQETPPSGGNDDKTPPPSGGEPLQFDLSDTPFHDTMDAVNSLINAHPESERWLQPMLDASIRSHTKAGDQVEAFRAGVKAYHEALDSHDPYALKVAMDAARPSSRFGTQPYTPEEAQAIHSSVAQARIEKLNAYSPEDLLSHKEEIWSDNLRSTVDEANDPDLSQALQQLKARVPRSNSLTHTILSLFRDAINGDPQRDALHSIIRSNSGKSYRNQVVLEQHMQAFDSLLNNLSKAESLRFMARMEGGEAQVPDIFNALDDKTKTKWMSKYHETSLPEPDAVAGELRRLLDLYKDNVNRSSGALENFYTDYLPHIFENYTKAQAFAKQWVAKTPLEGTTSYLRQRHFAFMEDAVMAGNMPLTFNPVRLAMMRMEQMGRFSMAHDIRNTMIDKGLARPFKMNDQKPEGWIPLEDKLFSIKQFVPEQGGIMNRGQYYAPEAVAKDFNEFVNSGATGKWVIPHTNLSLYDAARGWAGLANRFQLSISVLHGMETTLNASASELGDAMIRGNAGDYIGAAKGVMNWASIFGPVIRNVYYGDHMIANFRDPNKALAYKSMVSAAEAAGVRLNLDPFFETHEVEKLKTSWGKVTSDLPLSDKVKPLFKLPFELAGAAIEKTTWPLMNWFIPRAKLGGFAREMKRVQDLNPGASQDFLNREAERAWDSMDDRFGEFTNSNWFVPQMTKDILNLTMRSPGWNVGTARQGVGGLLDLAKSLKEAPAKGRLNISSRTAFMFALPMTIAYLNAIYQKLHTGQFPTSATDAFFPQTGTKNRDGEPNRVMPKSYVGDVINFYHDPELTLFHKAAPEISTLSDIIRNSNYYGREVYDPASNSLSKIGQVALFAVQNSSTPFSLSNYSERKMRSPESQLFGRAGLESSFGYLPAPKWVGKTDAENLASQYYGMENPQGIRDKEEMDQKQSFVQLRQKALAGEITSDQVTKAISSGKLKPGQIKYLFRGQNESTLEYYTKGLHSMDRKMNVYRVATPAEKQKLLPSLVRGLATVGPEQQAKYMKELGVQ